MLDTPSPEEGDTSCESQKDRSGEDAGEYWTSADNDDESSRDSGKSRVKSSRKKKDSYHKRLENAFIKSNKRIKRKPDTNKLLSTLDPLHQATLSNLTNIAKNSYNDLILEDDHDCEFEDVMYKLALYSPPISDHGNMSPPQAMSPTRHYLDDVDVITDEFPRQTRHVWTVNGSIGSPTVVEHPTDMNDTGHSESPVYAKSPGSTCSGGSDRKAAYSIKEAVVKIKPAGGETTSAKLFPVSKCLSKTVATPIAEVNETVSDNSGSPNKTSSSKTNATPTAEINETPSDSTRSPDRKRLLLKSDATPTAETNETLSDNSGSLNKKKSSSKSNETPTVEINRTPSDNSNSPNKKKSLSKSNTVSTTEN